MLQSVMCKIFLNMPYLLLKKISEKKRGQLPVPRDLTQTTEKSMGIFPLFVVTFKLDNVLEKGNYAQSEIPLYICTRVRARVCARACLWVGDGWGCVYTYEYAIIHI